MQCESQENGLIVHNGTKRKNEKLSVRNITSCLRLNLPDSMSIPSSHPIVKPCNIRHMPSNSQCSEVGICSFSGKPLILCDPLFDELIMFDSPLVLPSLLLAHWGFFMFSGQSFKLSHRAILGGAIVNFDGTGGTSWDWGRWSFDGDMWRRGHMVMNHQGDGGSSEEHGLCYGKESTSAHRSRMNLKPTNTHTKPNTNPKTQITCPLIHVRGELWGVHR